MGEESRERERVERNRERSEEAHWQAAEAGAEEEEDRPPGPLERPEDDRQD